MLPLTCLSHLLPCNHFLGSWLNSGCDLALFLSMLHFFPNVDEPIWQQLLKFNWLPRFFQNALQWHAFATLPGQCESDLSVFFNIFNPMKNVVGPKYVFISVTQQKRLVEVSDVGHQVEERPSYYPLCLLPLSTSEVETHLAKHLNNEIGERQMYKRLGKEANSGICRRISSHHPMACIGL